MYCAEGIEGVEILALAVTIRLTNIELKYKIVWK